MSADLDARHVSSHVNLSQKDMALMNLSGLLPAPNKLDYTGILTSA
jgi:hypothetical protein